MQNSLITKFRNDFLNINFESKDSIIKLFSSWLLENVLSSPLRISSPFSFQVANEDENSIKLQLIRGEHYDYEPVKETPIKIDSSMKIRNKLIDETIKHSEYIRLINEPLKNIEHVPIRTNQKIIKEQIKEEKEITDEINRLRLLKVQITEPPQQKCHKKK